MPLSKNATKILRYLGIYKQTPTRNYKRTTGYLDDYYNGSWIEGGMNSSPRKLPRTTHGLFKTGMAELIAAGY